MNKVFPQIRLFGDKTKAAEYIRRGQQELFCLQEMKRTSGVPILKQRIEVDEHTVIIVQISGDQEFIEITYIPFPFAGEGREEKEEKFWECPPIFSVYKNNESNHYVGGAENRPGYLLAPRLGSDRWAEVTVGDYNDTANGGWYGLKKMHENLNYPGLHKPCDLITWYGNPNSVCDDSVWTSGTPVSDFLLKPMFFYRGVKHHTPRFVLGACILPKDGIDYFYILTTKSTGVTRTGGVDSRIGGSDEVILRKDVTLDSHPTDGWETVGTVDYSDYTSWQTDYNLSPQYAVWYLTTSTAYIDDTGAAWFTKVIVSDTGQKQRSLMKVDLRTAAHSREKGEDLVEYWWSHSAVHNLENFGQPPNPAPTHEENHQFYGGTNGEQYIFTMGGLEARYDVYLRIKHSYTSTGSATYTPWIINIGNLDLPSLQWAGDLNKTKSTIQETTLLLVIKRNDEEFFSTPLLLVNADAQPEFTTVSDTGNPTWTDQYDIKVDGASSGITEYHYMFLHPHMLKYTTYFKRDIDYFGTSTAGVGVTMTFKRGTETLAGPFIGYKVADGTFSDYFEPGVVMGNGSDSGSSVGSIWTDQGIEDGRPHVAGGIGSAQASGGIPIGWANGSVGVSKRSIVGQTHAGAVTGYGHSAMKVVSGGFKMYNGEYTATHRPVKNDGPRSYILCLQEIMDASPTGANIDGFAYFYKERFPLEGGYAMENKVIEESTFTGTPLVWCQSNTWRQWAIGTGFYAGEYTRASDAASKSHNLWKATSAHTATANDYPGMPGAPWEKLDARVLYFSNVIPEVRLNKLTGEDTPDVKELGVL